MATSAQFDVVHRTLLTICTRLDDIFEVIGDLQAAVSDLQWQGDTDADEDMDAGSASDTDLLEDEDSVDAFTGAPRAKRSKN